MKKFLSVKEFSKISGVSSNVLRYWDDIGLFVPAKREEKNNYRYYSLNQIIFIKFILILEKLGIPLETIKTIINSKSPEKIIEIMEKQERVINKKLQELHEIFSIIYARKKYINLGLKVDVSKITIEELEEQPIIMGDINDFSDKEFYSSFFKFCEQAKEKYINLNFPIGGYYKSSEDFFGTPREPYCFFSVDQSAEDAKMKTGKYLVGYTRGYYVELDDISRRMKKHAEDNSIKLEGPVYAMYLHDEICVQNPNEYLARVCIKIKEDV